MFFLNVTKANIWNQCYREARVKIGGKEARQETAMAWSRVTAGKMMEVNGFELHVGSRMSMYWKKTGYREMRPKEASRMAFSLLRSIGIKQVTMIERLI